MHDELMKNYVLCYITRCISVKAKRRLGGTYRFHHQGHPEHRDNILHQSIGRI
jgi:hypothetical protein